eukprot:snap_masked-scaffold_32-processed-gene-0.27-mRNA-1 protein AED:1.00 eAED:1.00 QI:0/0/0/0/1/1/2/0/88
MDIIQQKNKKTGADKSKTCRRTRARYAHLLHLRLINQERSLEEMNNGWSRPISANGSEKQNNLATMFRARVYDKILRKGTAVKLRLVS